MSRAREEHAKNVRQWLGRQGPRGWVRAMPTDPHECRRVGCRCTCGSSVAACGSAGAGDDAFCASPPGSGSRFSQDDGCGFNGWKFGGQGHGMLPLRKGRVARQGRRRAGLVLAPCTMRPARGARWRQVRYRVGERQKDLPPQLTQRPAHGCWTRMQVVGRVLCTVSTTRCNYSHLTC